tara:strand:- start:2042 stop:2203 length:162 start_codon:yes stop_codon:yes gene_type:complete
MAHHYGDFYPNYEPTPIKGDKSKTKRGKKKNDDVKKEQDQEEEIIPPTNVPPC